MEWLEEAEAHLRSVRREEDIVQQAKDRRHMEDIIKLTLEVERLRAEVDSLRQPAAELRK